VITSAIAAILAIQAAPQIEWKPRVALVDRRAARKP